MLNTYKHCFLKLKISLGTLEFTCNGTENWLHIHSESECVFMFYLYLCG